MSGAGTRRVIAVASALVLLGVTLVLLFCTEQIAVRFWFAVAVTAAIVSFVGTCVAATALCQRSHLLTRRRRAPCLPRETGHDDHGCALLDLFFYLNADTFEFLWGDYRRYVVVVFAALAAALILAALTWCFDTTPLSRLTSCLALVAAVAVAGGLEPQASTEGGAFVLSTRSNSFVSAFYLSWSETWRTLVRGHCWKPPRERHSPTL